MSSADPRALSLLRRGGPWLLACALVFGAGCTVRPLYSNGEGISTGAVAADVAGLRSIAIAPVDTRFAQQVRNDLIFLLNGGAGQPADAAYAMVLGASSVNVESGLVSVDTEERFTAGTITLAASYSLTDVKTGTVVATGRREMTASYDRSNQEFAVMRARRDAEDRAARELAELLRIDIGQKLSRLSGA